MSSVHYNGIEFTNGQPWYSWSDAEDYEVSVPFEDEEAVTDSIHDIKDPSFIH